MTQEGTSESPSCPRTLPCPAELYIEGNIWADMGDRPHDALVEAVGERPIAYAQIHQVPGHSPGGAWIVSSAALTRNILLDTETFSSARTTSLSILLGEELAIVPIEADPPEHGKYRAVTADFFKPRSIDALAGSIRFRTDELLDSILPEGGCDFVAQFGRVLPASIFLDLFGLPGDEMAEFQKWSLAVSSAPTSEERVAAMRTIRDRLREEIIKRRTSPANDLLSSWANAQVDGRPVTDCEAIGGVMLLFVAGLDTVAAFLGWMFRHLAESPEDQDYLRRDPSRISGALDEFLRYYSAVALNRRATRDVEIGGVHISRGETVTCPTTLASRDPGEFDEADKLDIRRGRRRHFAFGYGPHTCIGLHLARLEMMIALERWLARVSSFELSVAGPIASHGGTVIALDRLPLRWRSSE